MKIVSIERRLLEGWDTTPPLTGKDWRDFAESMPASEFATAILSIADAMDNPRVIEPQTIIIHNHTN